MKRRKFVQLSGMGVISAPLVNYTPKSVNTITDSPEIVVIGAGTFGVWTAYHLSQMGAKVTLLDAYGPGNSRASSGGETRYIQTNTDNNLYIRSAVRAYEWWKKIEAEAGEKLVLSAGYLVLSSNEAFRQPALNRQQNLAAQGVHDMEILNQDEIKHRWPQIYSDDIAIGAYYDGGPAGSTIMARKGIPALADQPIIESRVCQVTNSVDGNFVVDQLPSSDNTWIIGAGSGHGFKHGPAIGEYAAKRILGEAVDLAYNELFKLKQGGF